MRLVTVATHSQGYFPFLLQSCKRFGAHLEVLGWGQKWQGFQGKILLIQNYINTLHDDEIVCFIDAFDVLLLRPLDELEEAFKKLSYLTNKKIIVGCEEVNDNYVMKMLGYLVFGRCQGKPLNSGTYIGYVKDIRRMLDGMIKISNDPKSDDQVIMTKYCVKHFYQFHLDCDCILFFPFVNPMNEKDSKFFINNDGITYKWTKPYILHCPGNADMNDIILKLGYHITKDELQILDQLNFSIKIKKVMYFFPFYIKIILSLIIIIALSIFLKKVFKDT